MIVEFDQNMNSEKRIDLERFNKSSDIMTFIYNYIEDSPMKCLYRLNDAMFSQDNGNAIDGRVIVNGKDNEYFLTIELSSNAFDDTYAEEQYHAYQNLFPERINMDENLEFEAKIFKAAALSEANSGFQCPESNFWKEIYWYNKLDYNTAISSDFSKKYIEEGNLFRNQYTHYNENSPYRAPVTTVPSTLLYLLKNINDK